MRRFLSLIICVSFLVSCVTIPKIDPTAFLPETIAKESVPDVCKRVYETAIPRVAIVNFQNNTTFDYASTVQSNVRGRGQSATAGGVAAGQGGVVWGAAQASQFEAESQSIQREINAKLSESIEEGVVDEIVNLGGARIYSRADMQKVMEEQKFQQSGLADDTTLTKLGKLAGVEYIITGAVNNVNLSYIDLTQTKKQTQDVGKQLGLAGMLIGLAATAGMESQEGWNVSTEVTVRVIDVETGQIVVSEKVTGKHIIGKIPYPNYDSMIGGMKKAASKSLGGIRPKLSKYFSLKGYIWEVRTSSDGKQKIATINIGESHGLKPGELLYVYTFNEMKDPMSGKTTCNKVRLPLELVVSNQVDTENSWVVIKGEPPAIAKLRVGQIVERAPVKK
ncbi:MAG: hypothetical protein HY805_09425 [Nitrospirae bacterium]|nr:hypothetical protein [Nitrospirota bacterium]